MSSYNLSNLSVNVFIVNQLKKYKVMLAQEEHKNIELCKVVYNLPKDAMYDAIKNDVNSSNESIEYLHLMIHCFSELNNH